MIVIVVIGAIIFIIIFIFSSKTLSPIPYFPSQKSDIPLIVKSFNLKNDQIVFDLGAGDGVVIFQAAERSFQKGLNTKFVAVEINPILILIMYFRRLFHKNKSNIKILKADIFKFKIPLSKNSQTIYLYISPWFIEKVLEINKRLIKDNTIVSYMYPIKSLKKYEIEIKGKKSIFIYKCV